ncbi:MAG: hypothetical protein OEM67_11315 [Thermoleophilia bacterium]|nr:hypothetical protein [Thermoleophilia bacterium]
MKGTEFGFVILRTVGLLLTLYALTTLGFAVSQMYLGAPAGLEGDFGWMLKVNLVSWLVLLGVGVQLFVSARRIAAYLFSSAEGGVEAIEGGDFQSIAFSVLGLWLVVFSLPSFVQLTIQLFWSLRAGADLEREAFFAENGFYFLRVCLECAVGGWLFLRAKQVSRYWVSRGRRR